jgi:hypothetical protein
MCDEIEKQRKLEQLSKDLESHDWFHLFSEDIGVYTKGVDREMELIKQAVSLGVSGQELFNLFSNKRKKIMTQGVC